MPALLKMAAKRKRLTLKEKVEVIQEAENKKMSLRALSERFAVSKNQVANLLKEKDEVMKLWITNSNENLKTVKFRKAVGSDIDSITFEWFCTMRTKDIPVSGPLLKEKARENAESLKVENFKASNGWLEKFKLRHNINFKKISGESKSVDPEEVSDWLEKLKHICEGYKVKNIYNTDETGLLFRVLPNKTLSFKGEKCRGGKNSKERLTVLLCCNAEGDFTKTLVIGRSKKPRCFKNISTESLPVLWKYNNKAWMTGKIMSDWLISLNNKMRKEGRKILDYF